jgi:hypothetical protein
VSAQPRFVVARASLGSPIVRDTKTAKPVAVFPRDPDVTKEAADAAAMGKAKICAQALSRVHEELQWAKQQREAGKS